MLTPMHAFFSPIKCEKYVGKDTRLLFTLNKNELFLHLYVKLTNLSIIVVFVLTNKRYDEIKRIDITKNVCIVKIHTHYQYARINQCKDKNTFT